MCARPRLAAAGRASRTRVAGGMLGWMAAGHADDKRTASSDHHVEGADDHEASCASLEVRVDGCADPGRGADWWRSQCDQRAGPIEVSSVQVHPWTEHRSRV